MKIRILIAGLLIASPAMAQSKPQAGRADPCAPIGRTANGQLVYSMKCENLPVPLAPVRVETTAPIAAAPPPAEEEDKGGLFRNPFPSLIRPSSSERQQGVGPPPSSR